MNATAWKANLASVLTASILALAVPGVARGQANTCNGITTVDYITGQNFAIPGDILRVRLTLGTGSINGGTSLTIQTLRFDLDCNSNFALGLPCTDEGLFVEYEGDGTITNTCGKTFTTGHAVSGSPNEVVFTPNTPIVIPANQAVPPGFCNVEFDIKVLAAPSIDATPNNIEEVEGYKSTDAQCNNGVLASGGQQSSSIPLCPVCDDNNECTNDACNQNTGQCVFTPKPDSTPCADVDGNACTTAGCNAVGSCDQAHLFTVCPPDGNPCTNDLACDPQTGQCAYPPVQDSTPCDDTDGNACTTAGCEQGQCVQTHVTTPCPPDSNDCTDDLPCNPQTGLCEHPPLPDSTPCDDTDNNLCTTAGCEQGQCVQPHVTTPCPPDNNECTQDPGCNPLTGQCTHPPDPDSTPCSDTDGITCTTAGCEAGQCVQTHIPCPPPINHVQCYEAKPSDFAPRNINVLDQFGPQALTIRFPHRLCNPADKNHEGIVDPTEHLTGYKAKSVAKFAKRLDQTVVDQFGTLHLDVVRPDLFMVPTAKNGVPISLPAGDHFTCYKVKRTRGAAKFVQQTVTVSDQFQNVTETVIKPVRLCAPANKNGENPGAETHDDHLLCYKAKSTTQFGDFDAAIDNQFGLDQLRLIHRRELCVPAKKNPLPTTTSTSSTSTTSTTSSTSTTVLGSPSGAFSEVLP